VSITATLPRPSLTLEDGPRPKKPASTSFTSPVATTERFDLTLDDVVRAEKRHADDQRQRERERDVTTTSTTTNVPTATPSANSANLDAVRAWLREGSTDPSARAPTRLQEHTGAAVASSASTAASSSSASAPASTPTAASTLAEAIDQALRNSDNAADDREQRRDAGAAKAPATKGPFSIGEDHTSASAASMITKISADDTARSVLAKTTSAAQTAAAEIHGDVAHEAGALHGRSLLVGTRVSDAEDAVAADRADDADKVVADGAAEPSGDGVDSAVAASLTQRGVAVSVDGPAAVSSPVPRGSVAGLERLEDLLHDPATGIAMDGRSAVVTIDGLTVRLVTDAEGRTAVSMVAGDDDLSASLLRGRGALGSALEGAGLKLEQLVVNGDVDASIEMGKGGGRQGREHDDRQDHNDQHEPHRPASRASARPTGTSSLASTTTSPTPNVSLRVRA
jgi:hypothetical protein